MSYIIIEIQQSNDGACAVVPPLVYADRQAAEQSYHNVLSFAAVSLVNVHSVLMINSAGDLIKKETYYHGEQPGPEPEAE